MFFFTGLVFSQEFAKEAREYRQKGYQAQQAGDIELAIVYYKKAIALDPIMLSLTMIWVSLTRPRDFWIKQNRNI